MPWASQSTNLPRSLHTRAHCRRCRKRSAPRLPNVSTSILTTCSRITCTHTPPMPHHRTTLHSALTLKMATRYPLSVLNVENAVLTAYHLGSRPGMSSFVQPCLCTPTSPQTSLHTKTKYVNTAGSLSPPLGLCTILPSVSWLPQTQTCPGRKVTSSCTMTS